ncbi:MAG: O-antigen ligase family protein [Methylococcaceae bacterium]|nr:O-antigen ligase family protein [Methylococcaceae bacterium]MDZ4155016.1 O-antigen ligase family protein [Methylococcales bacterium]MDP2394539.1 O-antigen ligase family protein [Methylococcaceae bacterium]MDP3021583.1 O-antigen ligase family protein [Methylococcaceae bacterium]MDP3392082.1 O-antigen ligase family protein [Methylococcaceae bacterium]
MTEITVFFIFSVLILLRPTLIPYFSLLYLFTTGLASREFISGLKITLGSVNVFPLDLLYALSSIFAFIFTIKIITNNKFKINNSTETKIMSMFVFFFIALFFGKLINGFLDNLPLDSLLRMFMTDTQVLYFFLPLVIYKANSQLKNLIIFTVFLTLIFPLYQPFLINSEDTKFALRAQDTLRLGYGDGNILLGLGATALLSWEYKKYLTFLPLSGILMLGHRSSFIAIALSFMAISFLKGKKIQTFVLMGLAGLLVIIGLTALQSFTNINMLDKLLNRVEKTFEPTKTTVVRARVFPIVIEELQKRPYTGLDYQEFHEVIKRADHSPLDFNISHPHNFVYSSLMNTGIIGTLLMFTILIKSLMAAYKLAKTKDYKTQGAFLFSAILFFLVFSAMNTTMTTVGYVVWFLCGTTFWFFNQYKATNR